MNPFAYFGNLRIDVKLILFSGVIIAGQVIVAWIAMQGSSDINITANESIKNSQAISVIRAADIELLEWFMDINLLLNDQEVSQFKGELNRDKTQLAVFLASKERKYYESLHSNLKPIFAELEEEHKNLFEAGNKLASYFPDAKLDIDLISKSLDLYKEKINPGVVAVRGGLKQAQEGISGGSTSDMDIQRKADDMFYSSLTVSSIVIFLCMCFVVLMRSSIKGPIQIVGAALAKVAQGDLRQEITLKNRDEIGEMGDALTSALKSIRIAIESIRSISHGLVDSSRLMNELSQTMSADASHTTAQVKEVSNSSRVVGSNMSSVAAAAEQMNATIREVATHTVRASDEAQKAVAMAQQAKDTIAQLGTSSAQISSVVSLINSVAEQTNLLALNATIEAARAGEAGKGFAVVATEVKELAKQTGEATHDISERIQDVQAGTERTVQVIEKLSATVTSFSEISASISAAIEEQGATTNEISRSVGDAADGATAISQSMGGVAQAAERTSTGTEEILSSAHTLDRMAKELQEAVAHFKIN